MLIIERDWLVFVGIRLKCFAICDKSAAYVSVFAF